MFSKIKLVLELWIFVVALTQHLTALNWWGSAWLRQWKIVAVDSSMLNWIWVINQGNISSGYKRLLRANIVVTLINDINALWSTDSRFLVCSRWFESEWPKAIMFAVMLLHVLRWILVIVKVYRVQVHLRPIVKLLLWNSREAWITVTDDYNTWLDFICSINTLKSITDWFLLARIMDVFVFTYNDRFLA